MTPRRRKRCISGILPPSAGSSNAASRPGCTMKKSMPYLSGRQFVQLPGPTNVPERVLRAMSRPTIDHRGPEFGRLGLEVLEGMKEIFQTSGKVVIFPSSGTGAWEAALTNTLSPGDKVLMFEVGQFSALWIQMAAKLGLDVDVVKTDWRHGVDAEAVASKLGDDRDHKYKAVCVVRSESTRLNSSHANISYAVFCLKKIPGTMCQAAQM